jgi:hypothetical protein
VYGHEVLMSLQTRAKFVESHSNTSATASVTRYFNMTGQGILFFERVHNDDRVKLLLKVAVFWLMNHEAVGLVLVHLAMNFCLWIVAVYF